MRPKLLLLFLFISATLVFSTSSRAIDNFQLAWGHSAGHVGDPGICGNDYINLWVPQASYDPSLTYIWFITGGDCYGNTIDTLFSVIYNGTSNVSVYNLTGIIWCNAYDSNNQLVGTSQYIGGISVVHPDNNGGICSNYTSLCNDKPTFLEINQGNAWILASSWATTEFNWQLNGVDIPGADYTMYTPTVAGVYRVRFTTWCGTGYSNPITINDGGPGFNMAVNGYYYFCDGSSTQITANIANSSNVNYQYLWNTGETTKTISASSVGLYEVTATNPNGCTKTAYHTMGIHYPVSPHITPAGPVAVCQGESVILEGGGTGSSYYTRWWYRDGTPVGYTIDSSITVNQPGNYTMQVTNECGSYLSDPVSVTVSSPAVIQPTLSTPDPSEYCGSGLFEMNVSPAGPGYTYDWFLDGALWYSTSSLTVSTATEGTFHVEVKGNCESGVSNPLTFTFFNSRPSKPGAISGPTKVCPYQLGVVYSIAPLQDASSYQWSVSGGAKITGGQGTNTVTVDFGKKIGGISVKGVNACGTGRPNNMRLSKDNGCRIGELAENVEGQNEQTISVLLYPNPASDQVNLRFVNFMEQNISVVITNSLGQIVLEDKQRVDQNSVELNLSISSLEDGIYFVMVRAQSGTITRRLSVNRK